MITVVDQVRPWLTPSSTLAATIHAQDGARMIRSGTGRPTSQPATSTGLRPNRSASAPGDEVRGGLGQSERDDEGEGRGRPGQPEDVGGEQRQDRPLLPDHPADERVDGDEQGELAGVRAQSEIG